MYEEAGRDMRAEGLKMIIRHLLGAKLEVSSTAYQHTVQQPVSSLQFRFSEKGSMVQPRISGK